ncbi:microsomal signal peptidase 12 kDa subunit-domain-containing protein [Chaetomidium leptoderma]|uniref:Signal peptidase complex subunit 1 n=1 Tax=Chaetomidium leptoderma TaxID=669021 RepID=A0AAN6VKI7_9PEZI|nr:microsomal signal peptidase 12 kDa subunit-domain-containing protein [Chaetomidium leptoderma]
MAEQILEQARELFEGQIDFEGQKLVELLVNVALTLVGAIAFFVGYLLQDIKLAVYVGLAGTAAVFLLAVPPWPFFNRNPVKWLPVGGITPPANLVVDDKMFR